MKTRVASAVPKPKSDAGLKTRRGQNESEPVESTSVTSAELAVACKLITFVGAAILTLIVGGIVSILVVPEHAKDIWLIIGPVVSTAIAQLLANRDRHKNRQDNH